MKIWNIIKVNLNYKFDDLKIEEYYFPLFVTKSNLEKEKNHFIDFYPEVLWVQTQDPVVDHIVQQDPEIEKSINFLKSKNLDVHIRTYDSERYAVRPTSETIIYPHFGKWIKKGEYPKINQWANVVRWENKTTQPFIRSREFLWQEGHTCHPDQNSAINEMYSILDIYKNLYENILAVPMIDGIKTRSETFPGAVTTSTIEGYLPDSGKGIQSATSHYFGEKFSKIYDIRNSDGHFVHQNSWGLTTRSIGILVMTHSDDRGLVLPPNIAPIQVVIIPCGITKKISDNDKKKVMDYIYSLTQKLKQNDVRVVVDDNIDETPGMKFNKWEVKGVPLRIEVGPKDLENNNMIFVRRIDPVKVRHGINNGSVDYVYSFLQQIQNEMYQRALEKVKSNIVYCNNEQQMLDCLKEKKLTLLDWSNLSDDEENLCENYLKEVCQKNNINSTKVLCIPNKKTLEKMGFQSDKKLVLFGRSF
jgi:prolyl-tRNA synthetase family I